MSDETRYTLDEAKRQLALQDCATYGHDWDIVSRFSGEPVRLLCIRCGWGGWVAMTARGKATP